MANYSELTSNRWSAPDAAGIRKALVGGKVVTLEKVPASGERRHGSQPWAHGWEHS
jgi:hypothetical protein